MLVFLAILFALPAGAGQLTVAVASNFSQPARALAGKFEAMSGQLVRVTLHPLASSMPK